MTRPTDRLALIDAVIYGDVFGCAVTADELWRFSRARVDPAELANRMAADAALRGLVTERDGLFCLRGREHLLAQRPARMQRAARHRRRARRVARWLRHVPGVRGAFLTGSSAAGDARPGSDVDLLLLVDGARMATVFLVLGTVSRLTGRRPFCPNLYVAESHLAMGPPSVYVAREVAQAVVLIGDGAALRRANEWVHAWLPNALGATEAGQGVAVGSGLQRALERGLGGRLGDRLEQRSRQLAARRLHAHHGAVGEAVPGAALASLHAGQRLGFHRGRVYQRVEGRRREHLARLALALAEAEHAAERGDVGTT